MADADNDREGLVSGKHNSGQQDREPAPGEDHFRAFLAIVKPYMIGVLTVVFIYQALWIAAEAYAVHVYRTHPHDCSPLPTYLLVHGVSGFISAVFVIVFFAMIASLFGVALNTANRDINFESQSQAFVMTMIVFAVCYMCAALFHAAWLIYGSVVSFRPSAKECTVSLVYQFSFWFTVADWISAGLVGVFWCVLIVFLSKKGPGIMEP